MPFPLAFGDAAFGALESFTGGPSGATSGDIVGGGVDFGNVNIQGIGGGLSVPQNPITLIIIGVIILGVFILKR